MRIRTISIVGILIVALISCEKYDDYIVDYKFSAVYFATQKPLRTIVAYDEMNFKVGVALGGKRANGDNEYAEFVIDESLLEDEDIVKGNDFLLMPSEYYTLSNDSRMDIPAGEFIGDITVTLNKEQFTADELSITNTYAIPLRITNTSTDSILSDKVYSILVIKYISEYHGTYYHKGIQTEVDENGDVVEKTLYSDSDLINNATWDIKTVNATTLSTPKAGTFGNGKLILSVDKTSNKVLITSGNNNIEITGQSGTYNPGDRQFYLDYDFTRNKKIIKFQTLLY